MRILFAVSMFSAVAATAQNIDPLAKRHARIDELYSAANHAEVIREIDLQIKESAGTAWADSLHRYLYKYGRAHRMLKGVQAGIEAAERIYILVEERGNAAHQIEALFDLSWAYYDVGEMKQCARVDSLAVVVADRDPEIPLKQKGRARQYLAFDYSIIGEHRKSADWALAALEVYEKADSISPIQWAESYTAVGVAYWHLGRIRDAEGYYLKALKTLGDGTAGEILARRVSTNGNLGVLWQNAGDLARSRSYYHESLRCSDKLIGGTTDPFERDEAIVNRSRTYVNLATVYAQLGDDGRAREFLNIAWKDRSAILQPDDPQLLAIKDRLADLEMAKGSWEKAQELVTAHVLACERSFGKRSEEFIRSCSRLGEIHQHRGDLQKADSLLSISINAGETGSDAPTNVVLAETYQRRARLYLEQDRYRQAIDDLLKARQVMVNTYDSLHYKVAGLDALLAEAAFLSGDHGQAAGYAESALAIVNDRITALRSNRQPRAYPGPHIVPDAIYWKLRAEQKATNGISRGSKWYEEIDLAIAALARNRAAIKDDASKLLLIGAQERLFDLALDLAYEAYANSSSEQDIERFLKWSETDRSTLLKGRLNSFAGIRYSGVPDSITTRELELVNALEVKEKDRASATDLYRREKEYAELLSTLEERYPEYFQLRYGETPITLAQLRKGLLTKDRQLLGYAMTNEYLYMMVIGIQDGSIVRVPIEGISSAVAKLNTAIATRSPEAYANSAHDTYERVVAPIADRLRAKELLIIPDGPLHAINFEALLVKKPDSIDPRKDLFLHQHTIAYLLSATTALRFAQLARERVGGALAIAPGFEDELKQEYVEQLGDSVSLDHDFMRNVRQPFAMRTAEALGNSLHAEVLLANDASEKNFRSRASRYGIIHLGTHADLNAYSPMYSRLVLSKDGDGIEPDADGYLHAYEIYELDLKAQLAVLTACETGVGENVEGEGVRSLGYGFAYAGCPSLVMSLWQIDERSSSAIIEKFYDHLAEGRPKHEALRQAKLDHLATCSPEEALPFYWAGLVLVGDVEPLSIVDPFSWPILLTVAIAAIVLAFFWRGRRVMNRFRGI